MQADVTAADQPQGEYERRLAHRRGLLDRIARRSSLLGNARGIVFLAGLAVALGIVRSGAAWWAYAPVPMVPFVLLVIAHHRTIRSLEEAQRAVAFYKRGLGRLNDRWKGQGDPGTRYKTPEHLYAEDLDLFGRGSLFELLCGARTRMGEDTLAAWLKEPADAREIRARQEAVRELRGQLDMRERIAVLPQQVRDKLDANVLRAWIAKQPQLAGRGPFCVAAGLSLALCLAAVLWLAGWVSFGVAGLVFTIQVTYLYSLRDRLMAVVRIAENMSQHLALLSRMLELLQRQSVDCDKLAELRGALRPIGRRMPSQEIARLGRLIDTYDTATRNLFVAPMAMAAMWPLHVARAMERWRQRVGGRAAEWLRVVGQYEALLSLSGYAFERPDSVFPTIAEDASLVDGEQLGHPLLSEATCRRNDIRLDARGQMILISGSNMSGKSTMLRTVGVNVVLALAGAPVRATRLSLSRLAVGAVINVRDSLQEGQSHFYAEMARLRDIVAALDGDLPVLFLLDEIMHGTNSHDRRIGAEAVLLRLLEGRGIGLITTHDLALAEIVDRLDGRAENAHFQDKLIDGKMVFDYRMRPGVVRHSNALRIMRSLGLDV